MHNKIPFCIIAIIFIITSCKKNSDSIMSPLVAPVTNTSSTPTTAQLRDSAVAISKNFYLWNELIPSSFSGNAFTDYSTMMTSLRNYSVEPGFSQPVDKWSFAMLKSEWNQMSGGMGSTFSGSVSTAGDFGMQVFFRAEADLRVRLVEPNSPAGVAGIHRGWKLKQINGNTNITTGNSGFIIENVYNSNAANFVFEKPDGTSISLSLTAAHYQEKPVYLDTVYTLSGRRIGYFVFNSFLGNTSQIESQFSSVFTRFASRNITDIIVDLRYNGGGYVSLQESLANYLIPGQANGQLMMKQIFNNQHASNNNSTNFRKAGNVHLNNIYFIVGRGTASASELLINNLKPYMNVKLIGATATHGKPVGFFPIELGEWYLFPVSFKTVNVNGEGNYYNGLPLNAQIADGLDKDWGDIQESSLASAIRNITTGSYLREAPYSEPSPIADANELINNLSFKITVDARNFK